jgi:hypothetical protein
MDRPPDDLAFDSPDLSKGRSQTAGKTPGLSKSSGEPGRGSVVDRLATLSLVDTIGLGLYVGYLGSLAVVAAIRPDLAGEAIGVGLAVLVAVPLAWARRRTLARWRDDAGTACAGLLRRAYALVIPYATSRLVRLCAFGVLSVATPLLFAALGLFNALHAGKTLEPLAERQELLMPIIPGQFVLMACAGLVAPMGAKARGKPARVRPGDEARGGELALAAAAPWLGIIASIGVLNGSHRWIHDLPPLAATARAIPRLSPTTASGIAWALAAGLCAGYGMAGLLIFLLNREWRKRLGAGV